MSVYVDDAFISARVGRITAKWCHMTADTLEELHEMAEKIGMRREWFQDKRIPHYDLVESRRSRAIELGAIEVNTRERARAEIKKRRTA